MTTTADVMVDTLIDRGVEFIFGMPGDGINGVMGGAQKSHLVCQLASTMPASAEAAI